VTDDRCQPTAGGPGLSRTAGDAGRV